MHDYSISKGYAKGCYRYDSLNHFELIQRMFIKSYNFKMSIELIRETVFPLVVVPLIVKL